ncbi:MAG: twin-arginine translocase TatA/TatE family subunit [Bdellovibrio sp.]|nr:twin-arginine translocase TatA/TatE family subunit [Bdellovibrio sp.]
MGEFSIAHLLILTLILLIFFGPSRLPALGQSIGKAIKGFKQGLNEIDTEAKDVGPQGQLNPNQTAMNTTTTTTQTTVVDEKADKKS